MNIKFRRQLVLLAAAIGISALAQAQSLSRAAYRQAADVTGILSDTETSPANDDVLARAPALLMLDFPRNVRLVKLTLRNQSRDWVDISFRYDPRPNNNYSWQLPQLDQSVYYTADWAILGGNEQLLRGSFSFSFGPGAVQPSITREKEALLLDQRTGDGDPTTRFVTPPRTEIILDVDPPNYDPPFTIELEDQNKDEEDRSPRD